MNGHLPLLPVLVPFTAALLMLLVPAAAQRAIALVAGGIGMLVAALLLAQADGGAIIPYRLGDWPAPFGIVLVVDRLAAIMLLLVAVLALPALLMALGGVDRQGAHFHALFQLQLAGLNGAFLTGDLFNLFVFFEILLLASYALFLHGAAPGDAGRARAGLVYVILNLVGSALFLVALALVYASLGTLNLGDVARLLFAVPADDRALARTAMALLAAVYLLKSAVLPMSLWLPHVYARASAPAAVLFVILTKVGIVMLLRLVATGWGDAAITAGLLMPWLPVLALATIMLAAIGLFAARRLAEVAAWLVLASSGTLLGVLALGGAQGWAPLLYYLVQSTLVTGGLFLLAGHVASRRGALGDRLVRGPSVFGREYLLPAWAVLAVGLAGLPPLSGFIAKLMLLQITDAPGWTAAWWTVLLLSSLVGLLVLARITAPLFWQAACVPADGGPQRAGTAGLAPHLGLWLLVAAGPLLALLAQPAMGLATRTAAQLADPAAYQAAVLGDAAIVRERRP